LALRIINASTSANSAKNGRTHAGPICTDYPLMRRPLLTFVKELTERPGINSLHINQTMT
jgi:hypothetical protein